MQDHSGNTKATALAMMQPATMSNRVTLRDYYRVILWEITSGDVLTSRMVLDVCEQYPDDKLSVVVALGRQAVSAKKHALDPGPTLVSLFQVFEQAFDVADATVDNIQAVFENRHQALAHQLDWLDEAALRRLASGVVPVAIARSLVRNHRIIGPPMNKANFLFKKEFASFASRYISFIIPQRTDCLTSGTL